MSNQPVPADGPPEIIVRAQKRGIEWTYGQVSNPVYGTGATLGGPDGGSGGGGSGGSGSYGIVNVQVDNINNLAQAIEAAQNVATALAKMLDQLSSLNVNDVVVFMNNSITVGNLIDLINKTEWVVTDRMYANAGVGSSYTPQNGNPRDYLNFSSFRGPDGYASPNYTNMQGMIGILLHELAHLSTQGQAFTNASESTYLRKNDNSYEDYYRSNLARNNEIWANDFMKATSTAFGLDTSTFNPQYGYGAKNPAQVPFP